MKDVDMSLIGKKSWVIITHHKGKGGERLILSYYPTRAKARTEKKLLRGRGISSKMYHEVIIHEKGTQKYLIPKS